MKITAVETLRHAQYSNLVWVRVETDEGLIGLGETIRNPEAVVAYIHETCAPYLLGKDPRQVSLHAHQLLHKVGNHFSGFPTRSVEIRGNAAVDIALWDLLGKTTGQPVHQLLGGLCRDRIRVYNTCAGPAYNAPARTGYNTELVRFDADSDASKGRYEDLEAQIHHPAELAADLLEQGITAMKIWPFDSFALPSDGREISLADLKTAAAPVEAIRKAVGDRMDIMMEYHALWQLPVALQIADALKDFDIYWHEDPVPMDNFGDLAEYKRRTNVRVAGSENLGTKTWYREVFERRAIDVAHFDLCWIGGLTEGRKVAALAEAYDRPIAPHDCIGPVGFAANLHLLMSAPNALIMESVRAFYRGYYNDVVTTVPRIEDGFIYPLSGSGLGTELLPDFASRADVTCRRSEG
jgi:L-alanine-DL-glutamate epimerase-like enolase superfamily enzyme